MFECFKQTGCNTKTACGEEKRCLSVEAFKKRNCACGGNPHTTTCPMKPQPQYCDHDYRKLPGASLCCVTYRCWKCGDEYDKDIS